MQGRQGDSEPGVETSHHKFTFSSWESFFPCCYLSSLSSGYHTSLQHVLEGWINSPDLHLLCWGRRDLACSHQPSLWTMAAFLLDKPTVWAWKFSVRTDHSSSLHVLCPAGSVVVVAEQKNLWEFREITENLLWGLSLGRQSDLQEDPNPGAISRAQCDAARGINRNNLN